MSIKEFTSALQSKATSEVSLNEAQNLLARFVGEASKAFEKDAISRAASIISKGEAIVGGRAINLTTRFRELGEKQGRTALVLTEDDLQDIFTRFNIKSDNNVKPIVAYLKFLSENFKSYKVSHYEVYLQNGEIIDKDTVERKVRTLPDLFNKLSNEGQLENVIAIRGLNFSHKNTLVHVAHFLHTINAFPGKTRKEVEKILSGSYDRGHVYAQTYGRALVSLGDLAQEDNILSAITELYGLLDEATTSLNRSDKKYDRLLARAKKDFTGRHLRMNIQLQAVLENRTSGSLSQAVQIVNFLQNLIQNSKLSKDGKRQLAQPAAVTVKQFEKALLEFDAKLEKNKDEINRILAKSSNPDYLAQLRTSDNIFDFIPNIIEDIFTGKGSNRKIAANTPFIDMLPRRPHSVKISSAVKNATPVLKRLKNELNAAKKELTKSKRVKVTASKVPRLEQKEINLTNLQNIINTLLAQQIRQNMGEGNRRDVLNYRTGRFAQSAIVERITKGREGMISAYYTYMKYPYATFSEGGEQEFPRSRDPKLLISKSIREILQQQMITRMRAVLI